MHIFGKGAGARGGDGGERGQQSLIGYPDRRERAKVDARRALQCDLATVLLKGSLKSKILIFKCSSMIRIVCIPSVKSE